MYKLLVRPILFLFDPEKIHDFIFSSIRNLFKIPGLKSIVKSSYSSNNPKLEKELFGLKFKNPVGLAAGFDKDAKLFNELSAFGFGFIEIGTLTPLPQDGNPKKRMFRLPKDSGLINRMGFNNGGVKEAVERLKRNNSGIIIGGNIGKNKVTPNENAVDDYVICFNELHAHVDYFVVNVSSPNTPNLRALQDKKPLTEILNRLMDLNKEKSAQKPILLKIAPDLTDSQLDDIIDIVADTKIDGIISSNTTIARDNLETDNNRLKKIGNGGLSGKPLTKRSTEVIRYLAQKSNKAFPIIGVGGIHSAEDALEKLEAGADLVQIYTGFIYEGPSLIKKINKEILKTK
ncbi:MAG: quinone-dependent dihydroorotate dehydrogenase [Flavobacteriales bacterium]|jgi:dihydroorotate dehydrogenase|tara:strand:+ start:406 stop:1440 length:1035 start_codon:yes stop_codon:yes gene_type:complete